MLRLRPSVSLVWLAACATLLLLVAVASLPEGAWSMPTEGRVDASPALQELLRADKKFIDAQARREGNGTDLNVRSIKGNTPYNYAVATKLFWHSVSAYCADDSSLQSWSCLSCKQFGSFQLTAVMNNHANQGYVGFFTQGLPASPIPGSYVKASDPFVVVSFRGTVPSMIKDWIEDLSFSKFAAFSTNYPAVSVHGGFWAAYSALKAPMMAGIKTALAKTGAKTIIFTGHSLGAAMAEIAAIDLKLNEYPSLMFASYTQGTPRVGNAAFATLFSSVMDASFREIHQADLVPHLPPKLLGFQHGPMEVWFNEAFSGYTVCNATMSGEDPHCANSLALPVSVSDHTSYRGVSVGGYCSAKIMQAAPDAREVPVEEEQRDHSVVREDEQQEGLQQQEEEAAAAITDSIAALQEQRTHPRRQRIVLTEV